MCGIYGGHLDRLAPDAERRLRHRGPDQQGLVDVADPHGRALRLGQTRLSIVDRHDVPVPLSIGDATIVYNGEVYNWRDLRTQLETLGHVFTTQTDTEVVLAAYLEWGAGCLEKFNGMFAFAVHRGSRLFLARDRMGKKPLFYTHDGDGRFAFASEVKALGALHATQSRLHQQLEFYFDAVTPWQSHGRPVLSVLPGQSLSVDLQTGGLTKQTWWRLPAFEASLEDEREALSRFLEVFTSACELRKLADVPVTTFLSGGIDSSLIQAVVRSEKTYTVHFEEFAGTIDERPYVRELSERLGFEAEVLLPTHADLRAHLDTIARSIEMPVGSFSLLPLFMLSRAARRDGFEVGLSGEGADELFSGYHRTGVLLREQARIDEESAGAYGPLAQRYFGSGLERFARMASRDGMAGAVALVELLRPRWREGASLSENICRVEAGVFLQPLLAMADRMSMANGLEMRNPFLDYRVVELATKLHPSLKHRDGQGKWLLRRALRELVGDDLGVVKRSEKHGLPAPINQWVFGQAGGGRKRWNALVQGRAVAQLDPRVAEDAGDGRAQGVWASGRPGGLAGLDEE
ncbi:MAG: asparagine synthase (glutamine-hydrolyzing) [Phycisphaerales bacterium JB063]